MELKWKYCFRAGITVIGVYLLIYYWGTFTGILRVALGAAMPLFVGCILAYVVNILMTFIEEKLWKDLKNEKLLKIRRPVCMLFAYMVIVLLVILIIRMVVPELVACLQILLERLPEALETISRWAEENFQISRLLQQGNESMIPGNAGDWQEILSKVAGFLFTGVGGVMGTAVSIASSAFSAVVTFLLALIFSFYLLSGKEKICGQLMMVMEHYLNETFRKKLLYILDNANKSFHSFIVGQCIEAVILGLLCMTGMFLLRLPYAVMIGCLIGFTALIPVAGAYIGAAVGAFVIFSVSPVKALVFIVFLVILQQLEGNLIYPRVVGSSIGLPGIWVLAAVTVGGGMMGIVGMLLGVPLTATVYQLLRKDIIKRQNGK